VKNRVSKKLHSVGIKVLSATVGLFSNNKNLITDPEYFGGVPHPALTRGQGWFIRSQEANLNIETIALKPHRELDGSFCIFDYKGTPPSLDFGGDMVTAVGDWSALEEETLDRRYSLLGNQGVLFRYILTVLERKGIFNFHACGLCDRETGMTYLVLGERGSGKSALLLAALDSGRYLAFGTEIVHAGIEAGDLVFYTGCLRNNVRVGHMLYDFPGLAEKIGVEFTEVEDPWRTKVQLDFGAFSIPQEKIVDPELVLVIPRIEEELSRPRIHRAGINEHEKVKRTLLENLSDKIVSMVLAYERIPVGSLDRPRLLRNRKEFIDDLMETGRIVSIVDLFANPRNCLEGLQT